MRGALAVLPIGAAAKEHGFHLPLDTDFVQAEWLARELARCRDVVVWPTLSYGYYPVFVDYPGSISLTRETFMAAVSEILAGIFRGGARRAAVLNTGISTIEPLRAAIAAMARAGDIAVVDVYSGSRFTAAVAEVEEQSFGGHADEIETSMMLALAPGRVDMTRAEPSPAHIARGLFNRSDPRAPNYTPSGVNGDPRPATAEKGRRLLDALLADVLDQLDAWAR